jgi:hypothetical protein
MNTVLTFLVSRKGPGDAPFLVKQKRTEKLIAAFRSVFFEVKKFLSAPWTYQALIHITRFH